MRSSDVTTALLPALALPALSLAVALAPPSEPRQDGPGFLALPFTRTLNTPRLRSRQDVDVPLYNVTTISYLVELSIGTPGQTVRVAIDTGSSELWVNPNCKTVNTNDEYQDCVTDGQYNPDDSSTFHDLESRSSITYGIGKVELAYVTDNVALPNSTIDLKNIQFGAAIATQDLSEGILGLSFGNHSNPRALPYANLVDQLVMQGVTKSRAFSVALGNQDLDDGGVLVLGGLDTGKFSGALATLPVLGPQLGENIPRYWVQLESLGSTINGKTTTYSNSKIPVVIDTGSTLCNLPSSIVQDMVRDTNAQVDSQGDVLVQCSIANNNAAFNFAFSGVTISIPWSEFILPIPGSTTQCVLGVSPSSSVVLLGDSFIRSAYIVFDQDHMQVSMAPWADCGEHQQAIGSGPVGNVQGACNSSSSTNTTNHNSGSSLGGPGWVMLSLLGMISFVFASL
ncbi:aspartic peptidase domain-containing protein [Microdochium trichocladiopsis]|uniref:Aspartic peptidase domain-containing protein n=1 Tax=Microdochium trichocladiopsis TaxID=1682393 RepID=A0A9P8YEX8_9PEZI|nr:aspartic peptidase domain-containing protein [Microdochium trichocladiopsis]KAH7035742.1 aspartic peptidase domain-containing protein [Microdochium trichocladiopsis]